jgi:ribosomal-protein-alanine N-acetyltransferase
MNFEIIKTDRLILRRLSPNDFEYIFENYSEVEIKKLLGHNSDEEFLKEKAKYEKGYTTYNRSFEYFQILDTVSMCIIGGCGFHNWYFDHRRAELGYSITNENFKRKGIMSEALKAIIDYGFNKMNLHRIEALVGSENIASQKLVGKYNFIKEGVLRQHYFIDGKFEDSVVFSKLKSD